MIRGKAEVLRLLLIALLSRGHILLEDVPGVGKTTLAKTLARLIEGEFRRIQFTPDLLPTDILGTSIYDPKTGSFSFKRGPIFTNILLADEINRASPRTQSSLLEAMSETQVTADGVTQPLPPPFLVVATQNPVEYHGTYPLPEAQLDRFAVQLHLGYPDADEELRVIYDQASGHPLEQVRPVVTTAELAALQELVEKVAMEESVGRYLLTLVTSSRAHPSVQLGVSPRGALMLFKAARARALLEGRNFVAPEDLRTLAQDVLAHRLVLETKAKYAGVQKRDVIAELVAATPVPR